jgi:hypothetical protein
MIRRIRRGSAQALAYLTALKAVNVRKGSGRDLAIRAIDGSPNSRLLVAVDHSGIIGAANYRIERRKKPRLKRINMGALKRGRGIGKAFVREMLRIAGPMPVWCWSMPQSWGFCEALGMTPGRVRKGDGCKRFHWTRAQAEAFLRDK